GIATGPLGAAGGAWLGGKLGQAIQDAFGGPKNTMTEDPEGAAALAAQRAGERATASPRPNAPDEGNPDATGPAGPAGPTGPGSSSSGVPGAADNSPGAVSGTGGPGPGDSGPGPSGDSGGGPGSGAPGDGPYARGGRVGRGRPGQVGGSFKGAPKYGKGGMTPAQRVRGFETRYADAEG